MEREKRIDLVVCTECIFDELNTDLLFETLTQLAQANSGMKVLMAQGIHNSCGKSFQEKIKDKWIIETLEKTNLDPEYVNDA